MNLTTELISQLDAIGNWGLVITDTTLKITGWNRWLERHTGKSTETVIGLSLYEVFPELTKRKMEKYYRQALDGNPVVLSNALHKYLFLLPPPAQDIRNDFMQQTARIVPLKHGSLIDGTITFVDDVTERLNNESELRERLEALREADRQKDEFLAMLAHELRNPLAPIQNAVKILNLTRSLEPTSSHALDMIQRQVAHMVRLVDDLLDVSRVSRGKIQLQKGVIDLNVVVKHAIEASKPHIESRSHELSVELFEEPVLIEGDYTRLGQVVSNLLNNAAKYTEPGGKIHVSLARSSANKESMATLSVRDNGRGIEPAALANLFDLFYQVDRNLDRSEGGLGIGLSLVKNLVEMHGGTVEGSSPGKGLGSEFVVSLPAHIVSEQVITPPIQNAPIQEIRKLRILVVDDNRDSADSLAMLLEIDGHDVKTVNDGVEAIEIALTNKPDVILLDIGLPKMNGYEVCQAIREGGLDKTLIVAITGYGMDEDRKQTEATGFNAHLVKPAQLASIRKLLVQSNAIIKTSL